MEATNGVKAINGVSQTNGEKTNGVSTNGVKTNGITNGVTNGVKTNGVNGLSPEPRSPRLFVFSASDSGGIARLGEVYQEYLSTRTAGSGALDDIFLRDLSFTLSAHRSRLGNCLLPGCVSRSSGRNTGCGIWSLPFNSPAR